MRSSVPIPGNPWPHDMLITVEDSPHALVDLLWIREAWNLQPAANDLPPLLSDESVKTHARMELSVRTQTWQNAWSSIWEACVHHAGILHDENIFDQLRGTGDGSMERAELLKSLIGPSWRDEFGDEAFTDQYEVWNRTRAAAQPERFHIPLDEEPERVSLTALIPAWRAGLSKIVSIPCQGSYTRVVGRHTLLMTDETRADPRRYSDALKQFR